MSARIDTAAERARLDGLTGHDPAPWCTEYDEWDGRYVTTLERLNETLVPIAKVGVDYDEPFESRQQACASLIAAAPDLLVGYRAALDEIDRLTAALAEAEDRAHYANGVAELAMKHRDIAERALTHAEDRGAARMQKAVLEVLAEYTESAEDGIFYVAASPQHFADAIRALPLREPGGA